MQIKMLAILSHAGSFKTIMPGLIYPALPGFLDRDTRVLGRVCARLDLKQCIGSPGISGFFGPEGLMPALAVLVLVVNHPRHTLLTTGTPYSFAGGHCPASKELQARSVVAKIPLVNNRVPARNIGASEDLKMLPVALPERPNSSLEQLLWILPNLPVEPRPATGLMCPLDGGAVGTKAGEFGS